MLESVKKPLVISIYAVLILGTLLVYWQVRNFDFINYDDNLYVYKNPHVLNGLTAGDITWAFTTAYAQNWHPLTWLSLMLDCQLFGPNPGWIHFVSLLMHIANTLLLFAVLKKMTNNLWPSAFVAAAFALHPMHVESVAWIAERKDVLSTLFFMLTLMAYADYAKRPRLFTYLLAVLAFALGLMAKPMIVTLPFVLLLLDYWPLNRFAVPQTVKSSDRRQPQSPPAPVRRQVLYRIIIEKIPFFALAAVSSLITFLAQQAGGAVIDVGVFPLQNRIANAFQSYINYVYKMFWPQNLAIFYPFQAGGSTLLNVLSLLIASIIILRFARNKKYLAVGWFWFIGTLIPVIGLVQVGKQAYADRYTYIPYIGLFIMIAWGIPELLAKLPYRKIILGTSMLIVLAALALTARRQVSYWNNSVTLFAHTVGVTKDNYLAYYCLAEGLRQHRRFDEAIAPYREALKLKPDWPFPMSNIAWIMATHPQLKGRNVAEAVRLAQRACELTNPPNPIITGTLAAAYAAAGDFPDAVTTARKAMQLADAAGQPELKSFIEHQLTFYAQHKPYVEPAQKTPPDAANHKLKPAADTAD